jgi:ABC-type Fe3+-hydroxamate transport system substrate-binding protein
MFSKMPERIISVVPSQTELLFDLGLDKEVIGITRFCIHPQKWFKEKPKIGGTKKLNIDKIISMCPDLIIANKEENTKEDIEILKQHFPVWISDIYSLEDALKMIAAIGELTEKKEKAAAIIQTIKTEFALLDNEFKNKKYIRTAYFIWYNPMMAAAKCTFIDDMLNKCKFENAFADKNRYPKIAEHQLQEVNPELILLSSEPFPFKEKHIAYFKEICPNTIIKLVDGELFSWYGSRLMYSAKYFKQLREEIDNNL